MTPTPMLALLLLSGCVAFPALGADPVVSDEGAEALEPALRVAWVEARQREGGAAYALAGSGGGFRGHNPARGFSVALDAGVVRLDGGAPFALALDGVGRAGDLDAPSAIGAVTSDGQKVSWHRGALTEWYLNGPLGLEQGFDVREPFPGIGEVVLSLVVTGEVTPVASGASVRLVPDRGPTWELGDLLVVDAAGRRLPSRMTVSGDRVALRFDDAAAVYPVLVDPVITTIEEEKLVAGDGASGDEFGYSVAVSGDTAVVGAWGDDDGGSFAGSAYVYVRSGTTWAEQAVLVASDPSVNAFFGHSVAVSGDTALVGAWGAAGAGGAAYVFVRSGTTWTEQDVLVAGDAAIGDRFGWSVALSGDTAVVGASEDDDGGFGSGSAYVFVRTGTTWAEQDKLVASTPGANHAFGYSVAASGDTAVVGGRANAAYVYVRSGTTWTEQQKLVASDVAAGDFFGQAVALSGDTVVVGSPYDDDGGNGSGSAYVFERTGTTWAETEKLAPADPASDDNFGYSVAASGDTLVVGAPYDDNEAGSATGGAYVYVRADGGWAWHAKFVAGGAPDDRYGWSAAVSGDTVVIGAPYSDDEGEATGSAWAFRGLFDADLDGVVDPDDNCPIDANPGQEDADADGTGDVCDGVDAADLDGDGVANLDDNCPFDANTDQADADADDLGDACDDTDGLDLDGDGVANLDDNCPFEANADQADADGDDVGDPCDDIDNSDTDDTDDGGDDTGEDDPGRCGCASPGLSATPSLLLALTLLIRRRAPRVRRFCAGAHESLPGRGRRSPPYSHS